MAFLVKNLPNPQVLCLLDLNGSKCPIFAKILGGKLSKCEFKSATP